MSDPNPKDTTARGERDPDIPTRKPARPEWFDEMARRPRRYETPKEEPSCESAPPQG
jgi:hypothetical protein